MKKSRVISLIASFILGLACCFVIPVITDASGNGGAVKTNGVIGFYEEDVSESSTSESSSSDSETSETTQSTLPPTGGTSKPSGKFPSTGELVKNSLTISGIALLVMAVLFLIWKRKNREGGVNR
ncbi:LPXTG cell wall anchor domain-containing protein [Candidatus Enterococcus clewellii]|uniref:Gram-positive cocci surface proteins LPxTG domain-containing protein n=1 Tax=Candidatus Enterococcus clewellii TaxID=1834193 RepID=A0A242K4X4_9ENTE|nr:LPXTG cell wall anchor domain-containing protein [Enterococcus sp. 9E7_DIV0242]OTP14578.1 hypothetical protein A5888_002679 [Enterococcus sp. 9E7_DIV0242]